MNKNLCQIPTCVNYGKYCRLHLADEEKQQKVDLKEYLKVRKQYLKKNPNCHFEGCKKKATEVHHPKGRLGKLLMDIKNMIGFCRAHHAYVEAHPHEAKSKGYSKSRHSESKLSKFKEPTA